MSFSNDSGATAAVAAGCQKNLRSRQAAAAMLVASASFTDVKFPNLKPIFLFFSTRRILNTEIMT